MVMEVVPWPDSPLQGRRRALALTTVASPRRTLTLTADNSERRDLLKEANNEIEHGWVQFPVLSFPVLCIPVLSLLGLLS